MFDFKDNFSSLYLEYLLWKKPVSCKGIQASQWKEELRPSVISHMWGQVLLQLTILMSPALVNTLILTSLTQNKNSLAKLLLNFQLIETEMNT